MHPWPCLPGLSAVMLIIIFLRVRGGGCSRREGKTVRREKKWREKDKNEQEKFENGSDQRREKNRHDESGRYDEGEEEKTWEREDLKKKRRETSLDARCKK